MFLKKIWTEFCLIFGNFFGLRIQEFSKCLVSRKIWPGVRPIFDFSEFVGRVLKILKIFVKEEC